MFPTRARVVRRGYAGIFGDDPTTDNSNLSTTDNNGGGTAESTGADQTSKISSATLARETAALVAKRDELRGAIVVIRAQITAAKAREEDPASLQSKLEATQKELLDVELALTSIGTAITPTEPPVNGGNGATNSQGPSVPTPDPVADGPKELIPGVSSKALLVGAAALVGLILLKK